MTTLLGLSGMFFSSLVYNAAARQEAYLQGRCSDGATGAAVESTDRRASITKSFAGANAIRRLPSIVKATTKQQYRKQGCNSTALGLFARGGAGGGGRAQNGVCFLPRPDDDELLGIDRREKAGLCSLQSLSARDNSKFTLHFVSLFALLQFCWYFANIRPLKERS